MKKIVHVQEFQIAQGATFQDSQLAPSKFNPWGTSGQLLISNTALDKSAKLNININFCAFLNQNKCGYSKETSQ